MAPDYGSAMLLGFTRSGRPVWQIAGAEGDGDQGGGNDGDKGDQLDVEAAKAAMKTVADLKEAGVENPQGLLDTVKNLRQFEKGSKVPKAVQKQIEDLQGQLKAASDAKLSDAEKLTQRIAELETKLTEQTKVAQTKGTRAAFLEVATKAKATYPEDVVKLVDQSAIEYDDDGNVTNAEALVEALKKERPALFGKPGTFDNGARQTAGGPVDMNQLLRQGAGRPS